jgi:hypothetical protein
MQCPAKLAVIALEEETKVAVIPREEGKKDEEQTPYASDSQAASVKYVYTQFYVCE